MGRSMPAFDVCSNTTYLFLSVPTFRTLTRTMLEWDFDRDDFLPSGTDAPVSLLPAEADALRLMHSATAAPAANMLLKVISLLLVFAISVPLLPTE
jgi:hypothetical protein